MNGRLWNTTVKLRVDRSRMVHSPTGSSHLFMILGFSTMYSSSLWRTDTIVFAKLNKLPPPPPQVCLKQISPPGGSIEDFNKQNCLPVNELNINGVTKKNLRFWTKISFLERVSIPSAWSYIWHICCSLFFISGNFYFLFCFNFISIHYLS